MDEGHIRAREVIDDIMASYGGISADERAAASVPVLRALDGLRETAAKATTILSDQLYSKDTRFVYELIQNAEDNTYDKIAENNGYQPSLTFTVTRKQVIVDSNEDGFTEANVRAICKVGDSTKSGRRGFIGEKGIGFKSVFKIASKVRVQSKEYCFAFEHGEDDLGLGMVTPINEDPEFLPDAVRTRFTLTFNGHSSFEDRVIEFVDLPDTLLLFLHKLKRITICIDQDSGISKTIHEYKYDQIHRLGTLTKSESLGSVSSWFSRSYYVERRAAKDLPSDKARPHTKEAEVVLAFPIDEYKIPVIEQQHVYAYLPMRKVGFSFQIQSDFITQASREDLFDSEWNRALLNNVAATFRQAVLRFRKDHPLEFTWMRYLPSRNISEKFWAKLRTSILESLGKEKVLQSWNGDLLGKGEDLRVVPPDCLDADGEPLLATLLSGRACHSYLSPRYSINDPDLLAVLGVVSLGDDEFVDAVHEDLRGPSSRYKSHSTNDDWHTRTAKKLLAIAQSNVECIRYLQCIPLQDGSWVSAEVGTMYFPEYRNVSVPSDLNLRLVRKEFLCNATRKELCTALGVKACSPKIVDSLIIGRYTTSKVELQSSVSHLRWIYHFLPADERGLDRRIPLFASDNVLTYRVFVPLGKELRVEDLYFETEEDFEVKKLCCSQEPSFRADHFTVHFLNKAYMDAVDPEFIEHGLSWLSWLEKYAAVRRIPRLVSSSPSSLFGVARISNLFEWLISNRDDQVVGTLYTHWSSYKDEMSPKITSILCKARVFVTSGEIESLDTTWMPTQELLQISGEFGLVEYMSFLKLPTKLASSNTKDWQFFNQFGVGFSANTTFYLEILEILAILNKDVSKSVLKHLLKAYKAIEKSCTSSQYDETRKVFGNGHHVLVPPSASKNGEWTKPEHCLWKAPAFIDCRTVLESFDLYRDNPSIKRLFTSILNIPDLDWTCCAEQLDCWRDSGNEVAVEKYGKLYQHVSLFVAGSDEHTQMCQDFESDELIYVPSRGKWCGPSSCMWAKSTIITGKVAIASDFPELEDFFVRTLQVKLPNKLTYIDELATLCCLNSNPSVSQVKVLLWEINSWGPSESDLDTLKPLNFIPVRRPNKKQCLQTVGDIFVLFDRQGHVSNFKDKVASLDFSMEDLRLLRPLICGLGLEMRYTSNLVEEESRAEDAILEPFLSKDLQLRAYAFYRCAIHYQDSGTKRHDDDLYQRLRQADVHLTNNICTTIKLVLNGKSVASRSTSGLLHLQDDDNHIRLYIPREARQRKISYLAHVPERMVAYFAIEDRGAAKVFGDIFHSDLDILDDVLADHGIVSVPGVSAEPIPRDETGVSSLGSATHSPIRGFGNRSPLSDNTVVEEISSPPTSFTEVSSTESHSVPSIGAAGSNRGRCFPVELVSQTRTDPHGERYTALLDHVIKSATSDRGHVRLSIESFVPDEVFGPRATNRLLHDMRIGAAGELFVFEYLQDIVPSLSIANWRSRVRHHVCLHEKYRDMPSFNGAETADIVYEDIDGALTRYLTRIKHLDETIWRDKTPRYFLEVKTTTQACGTRFFMSRAQVQRMERMIIPPGETANEVYVVMRVSNLGQHDIDLDFLVDPETLRRNGRLRVQAESYTVYQDV